MVKAYRWPSPTKPCPHRVLLRVQVQILVRKVRNKACGQQGTYTHVTHDLQCHCHGPSMGQCLGIFQSACSENATVSAGDCYLEYDRRTGRYNSTSLAGAEADLTLRHRHGHSRVLTSPQLHDVAESLATRNFAHNLSVQHASISAADTSA